MLNPFQQLIDWLSSSFDAFMAAINPVTIITSLAGYFASFLPEADPRLQEIVDQAVSAVDSVVTFISLFDYVINLPVYIAVISIILAVEAALGVVWAWRTIKAFVI